MTREEMIAKARETRKQVMNSVVPQELLDRYPARVEKIIVETSVGPVPVYDTCPEQQAENAPLLVYYHGGGFIRERTANDEVLCRRIACATGCRILDVDYSLAPDHPFPQAVNESYEVARWAAENAERFGAPRGSIALMGCSAGGNLVCTVNLRLKETHAFQPKLNVIVYPPLDVATDPGEKQRMGEGIPAERARLYNMYYADPEQQRDPMVSPVYAPQELLDEFPPTLIATAGQDDLCNEGEEFGLKLARAGVTVTMKRFIGAKHGFTVYRTARCDDGIELIVKFLRENMT